MQRVRYGPEKIALLPVLVFLIGTVPLATSSRAFSWLLLLPVAATVWVLRARVEADEAQLRVCNGLGTRTYSWSSVQGFDVPRVGPVRMLLPTGRVALTALPRRDLRRLLRQAPRTDGPAPDSAAPG